MPKIASQMFILWTSLKMAAQNPRNPFPFSPGIPSKFFVSEETTVVVAAAVNPI